LKKIAKKLEKEINMLFEIQEATKNLSSYSLVEYLVNDHFKNKTIVSASLRARSIVFLQMLSDINPATPIIFCHAGTIYPESIEYKQFIIDRLGFTDIRKTQKSETKTIPGDHDHVEWLMANYNGSNGTVKTAIHLNKSLDGFACWISAVYHKPVDGSQINRIDVNGKVLRVDPLLDWKRTDIEKFMKVHDLPFHKLASRAAACPKYQDTQQIPFYGY
jgi:phosphoadenosine phosphosulfate reductase